MNETPSLNERAARLIYPDPDDKITSLGQFGVRVEVNYHLVDGKPPFKTEVDRNFLKDLDDAVELWVSAPYEVQSAIELSIMEKYESDLDCIYHTIKLFTDPIALTEAVVNEWERHNADREEQTDAKPAPQRP